MKSFSTPHYDVVVCGGGPAGFGAALAAAREGASTLLVERLAHLGGMHTAAGVLNWCDTPGGPLFDELYTRMADAGFAHYRMDHEKFVPPGRAQMDTEFSKALMMQMLLEAGVEPLLLTHVDCTLIEAGRITGIEVVNKSGRMIIHARTVIDATADADIAADIGVPFAWGDISDHRIQHCNFRVWYDGIDRPLWETRRPDSSSLIALFQKAIASGGITPPDNLFQPQSAHFPYNDRTDSLDLGNWELENVDPTDARQVSRTLAQCYRAVSQLIPFCRRHLPGHANMTIRKLPNLLGTRESRRIVGHYTLTARDILTAAKFPDGIARACFYMDHHDSPPGVTLPHSPEHIRALRPPSGEYYEIPFRCLLPTGIENLIVAGRSISTDRDAQGSIRAMPTCLWMGHAAGLAAARSCRQGISVSDIETCSLRASLHLL